MKFKLLLVALMLIPVVASAQYLGRSEYDPITGGYRYYSAPGSNYDSMAGWRMFADSMKSFRHKREFNRQMELQERRLDLLERQMELQRMEMELGNLKFDERTVE